MSLAFDNPFDSNFSLAVVAESILATWQSSADELKLLSAQASDRRRTAFMLGRAAAHEALKMAGLNPVPAVLRGARGEPLWPKNFIGSISHSNGFGVAVVGRSGPARSIGIDLEKISSTRPIELRRRVCTAKELLWIEAGGEKQDERFCLLFSAKESLYKALSPLTYKYLGFRDVEITFAPGGLRFSAVLLRDAGAEFVAGTRLNGGYQIKDEFIFAYTLIR